MVERILTSVDRLLYELILLIVLIPKTLVRVVVSPGWISSYVGDQLDLPPEDQFQSYATPILFFIVLGTLPALILLSAVEEPYRHTWAIRSLLNASLEAKILCIAVFLASWPLAASIVLLLLSRKEISRRTLRPVFYCQAYGFGAAYFFGYLSIPGYLLTEGSSAMEWWKFLLMAPLLYFNWFAYTEVRLVRAHLKISVVRSLGVLVLMYFAGLVMMLLTEAILIIGLAVLEKS
jgi:hypothetical protein